MQRNEDIDRPRHHHDYQSVMAPPPQIRAMLTFLELSRLAMACPMVVPDSSSKLVAQQHLSTRMPSSRGTVIPRVCRVRGRHPHHWKSALALSLRSQHVDDVQVRNEDGCRSEIDGDKDWAQGDRDIDNQGDKVRYGDVHQDHDILTAPDSDGDRV